MLVRVCALAVAVFIGIVAFSAPGRAQSGNSRVFGELLKRIPEQSNVLMLVNVDGLFDSPMGLGIDSMKAGEPFGGKTCVGDTLVPLRRYWPCRTPSRGNRPSSGSPLSRSASSRARRC